MPGYNCSIKERMLYSSCKNSVVEILEQEGIEIAKKIEVDDGKELTETFLQDELHPKKSLNKAKFARPAPPSRGNRRITKQVWLILKIIIILLYLIIWQFFLC